jgi:hypothetical protein
VDSTFARDSASDSRRKQISTVRFYLGAVQPSQDLSRGGRFRALGPISSHERCCAYGDDLHRISDCGRLFGEGPNAHRLFG